MISAATILPGLPPYGRILAGFPAEWGLRGHEGTVVEFKTTTGDWVGNFEPGIEGLEFAGVHPNGVDAVVIAAGDLWVVNGQARTAQRLLSALNALLEVQNPMGWIFSRQGIALARFSLEGLVWHTRRISWDGFDGLAVEKEKVTGLAWSPGDDRWSPFQVDLQTGATSGGSYFEEDLEGWERLCIEG
jgi:hypothetical protein